VTVTAAPLSALRIVSAPRSALLSAPRAVSPARPRPASRVFHRCCAAAILALLAAALPVAIGAGATQARFARPVIVFLGDSLTAGQGLAPEQAYPAVLSRRFGRTAMNIVAINAGVSGETTAGGLRRIESVLRRHPDVVVVALGANDGLRGVPAEEIETNLRGIIAAARAAGARVLLAGMKLPPSFDPAYAAQFAAVFPRIAKDLDVPLVPFLLEGVGGVPQLNQQDRIHPTARGQEKIADNVYPLLLPLLAAPDPVTAPR
jgi:acyl-CoA thioesterase I